MYYNNEKSSCLAVWTLGGFYGEFQIILFFRDTPDEGGSECDHSENTWGHSLADRPKGYKYPVLWLQSGGGFDYTDWQRYTALELYAAEAVWRLCAVALTVPGIWIQSMGILNILHSCQSRHQIW